MISFWFCLAQLPASYFVLSFLIKKFKQVYYFQYLPKKIRNHIHGNGMGIILSLILVLQNQQPFPLVKAGFTCIIHSYCIHCVDTDLRTAYIFFLFVQQNWSQSIFVYAVYPKHLQLYSRIACAELCKILSVFLGTELIGQWLPLPLMQCHVLDVGDNGPLLHLSPSYTKTLSIQVLLQTSPQAACGKTFFNATTNLASMAFRTPSHQVLTLGSLQSFLWPSQMSD